MPVYDESTNSLTPERAQNANDQKGFRHWGDGTAGPLLAARLQAFNPTSLEWEDATLDDSSGGLVVSGGTGAPSGDVAIVDGASSSVKATVRDYTNSNPVAVTLTDTNGDPASAGAGTQYTEDAAAPANPVGTAVALIRDDGPSAQTTTDGDVVMQRATDYGAAYVQLVTSTGSFVDSMGGGTEYAEGATDATITGSAILWEDTADTLRAVSAAKPLPVGDAGGSLTVDNAALAVVGGGTEATAQRVTIATDSTGVVSVDDNGGSLTVDGTVTVTGTVTANAGTNLNTSTLALEAGGNLAAAAASLSVVDDWDETDRAKVNVVVGQAGITAGAGAVAANTPRVTHASDDPVTTAVQIMDDWDETDRAKVNVIVGQAGVQGASGAVSASTQRVVLATDVGLPAGTNNIGDIDIATVAAGVSIENVGDVAHDAPAGTVNPILIGGYSSTNEPTAVSTDADSVRAWFDPIGRQVVLLGHSNPELPVTVNLTADGQVIATPGASVSLYIKKGSVHNNSDTDVVTVALEDGSGGTERWKAKLAVGGGSLFDFGERGWKLTANTALFADVTGTSPDVHLNLTEFYVAA